MVITQAMEIHRMENCNNFTSSAKPKWPFIAKEIPSMLSEFEKGLRSRDFELNRPSSYTRPVIHLDHIRTHCDRLLLYYYIIKPLLLLIFVVSFHKQHKCVSFDAFFSTLHHTIFPFFMPISLSEVAKINEKQSRYLQDHSKQKGRLTKKAVSFTDLPPEILD